MEWNGTEPEVIDAQYGRGSRIRVGKLVLMSAHPAGKTTQETCMFLQISCVFHACPTYNVHAWNM